MTTLKLSPRRKLKINPESIRYLGLLLHDTEEGGIAVHCARTSTHIEVAGKEIPLLKGALKSFHRKALRRGRQPFRDPFSSSSSAGNASSLRGTYDTTSKM